MKTKSIPSASLTPAPVPQVLPYRRRQFLVDKVFQFRLMGRLILLALFSILLSNGIAIGFLKFQEWINPASQSMIYLSNSLTETLEFSRIFDFLWRPMLASAILGVFIVLIIGLFYSHRMAGPLYNLKRMLKHLEEGKLDITMRIRKTDEFHDIEVVFNQTVEGLRTRVQKLEHDVLVLSKTNKPKIEALFKELYDNSAKTIE
jgi:methyl-accepting chemotaxis protein